MSTGTQITTFHAQAAPRKASLFHLVFMMYSVICSGAYGLEEMVSSAGPGMTMLTLCVLPLIWALPLTLACAELSALYPVEGGYYRWARMAFGDFTGYMCGWLVWLSNVVTNATFAVLFANYLLYWLPLDRLGRWLVAAALICLTSWMNHRGIRLVGTTSVVFTILIFLPFLGMTLLGLLHWTHNPLVPFANPSQTLPGAFGAGLGIAVWLYSGYEKLTTNAAEVENPSRAFPIALAIAVPMTAGSYIIPTFIGLAATNDWGNWGEAHFMVAARAIGGPILGVGMAFGGLVSNASLLLVTILGMSRLPMVLAEDGMAPRLFRKTHARFGTPTASLLASGLLLSVMVLLPFRELAGLFSLVQVLAYLLIYGSLIKLRGRTAGAEKIQPAPGTDGHRPFRIPLKVPGLVLMTIPSILISMTIVVQTVWHDGALDLGHTQWAIVMLGSGPATYYLFRWWVSRGAPAKP